MILSIVIKKGDTHISFIRRLIAIPNLIPQPYYKGGCYDKLIATFKHHLNIVSTIIQHKNLHITSIF